MINTNKLMIFKLRLEFLFFILFFGKLKSKEKKKEMKMN